MPATSILPAPIPPLQRPAAPGTAGASFWQMVSRILWFPIKFWIAMQLCMTLVGSILVVGWTARFSRRAALKTWWRLSPARRNRPGDFRKQACAFDSLRDSAAWPNWILAPHAWQRWQEASGRNSLGGRLGGWFYALTGSLWANLASGFLIVLTTYIVLHGPFLIMGFTWWGGWINSFHKGYEEVLGNAPVTSLWGLLAAVLVAAAMFYLPLAQARQSITGSFRSFFQFHLIRRIIWRKWFSCLLLAVTANFCMLSVTIFSLATLGYGGEGKFFGEDTANMSATQMVALVRKVNFLWGLSLVPAFVFLRWLAARTYASGMAKCLRCGEIGQKDVSPSERAFLGDLGLLYSGVPLPEPEAGKLAVTWLKSLPFRAFCGFIAFLIWVAFSFQIYIQQFFRACPRHFAVHPMIVTPWLNYIAPEIVEMAREESRNP